MVFSNRFEAGIMLAKKLVKYEGDSNAKVLAIPRGGLQVGFEVAKHLNLVLDVLLVKKIGFPSNDEYAIGAAGLDSMILDQKVIEANNISAAYVEAKVKEIRKKLAERYEKYTGCKKQESLRGKTIILVDDGIATGLTMLATIELVKKSGAKKIVCAIPVGPIDSIALLKEKTDEVVCLETPQNFFAIGQFYKDFSQVTDDEAIKLLKQAKELMKK